jgi:hypothetical protein
MNPNIFYFQGYLWYSVDKFPYKLKCISLNLSTEGKEVYNVLVKINSIHYLPDIHKASIFVRDKDLMPIFKNEADEAHLLISITFIETDRAYSYVSLNRKEKTVFFYLTNFQKMILFTRIAAVYSGAEVGEEYKIPISIEDSETGEVSEGTFLIWKSENGELYLPTK